MTTPSKTTQQTTSKTTTSEKQTTVTPPTKKVTFDLKEKPPAPKCIKFSIDD